MSALKSYLGDSVYADVTSWGDIILTTENGRGPSSIIYLERQVMKALLAYVTRIDQFTINERGKPSENPFGN
jgi:hypothetical protein